MNIGRIVSSAIIIPLVIFSVINDWMFIAMICFLTAGGLYEFFYLIKRKDIPIYSYTGILLGLMIPVSIFMKFELTKNWELLFAVCASLMILLMQVSRKDSRNAIVGLSTTLFGVLYVSWFFSFLVKIRLLLPGWEGIQLLGFILVVTKTGDIGALLFGSRFGKHLLMPSISPNKTVEGCLGGLLFGAVAAILCQSWLPDISYFTVPHVAAMGAFFSGLGQLGDLSESMIKRDCNVKDSGSLFPSMGGVLDIIDSLLFSAPAFYLYMSSSLNVVN